LGLLFFLASVDKYRLVSIVIVQLLKQRQKVDDLVVTFHHGYILGDRVESQTRVLYFLDFSEGSWFVLCQFFCQSGSDMSLGFAGEMNDG
jgi:hypothetical protein